MLSRNDQERQKIKKKLIQKFFLPILKYSYDS